MCNVEHMFSTNTNRQKHPTRCWLTSSCETSTCGRSPGLTSVLQSLPESVTWTIRRSGETTFHIPFHNFRKESKVGHSSSFLSVIFSCALLKSDAKMECVCRDTIAGYRQLLSASEKADKMKSNTEHRWPAECPADELLASKVYYNNQNENKFHAKISNSRAHAAA